MQPEICSKVKDNLKGLFVINKENKKALNAIRILFTAIFPFEDIEGEDGGGLGEIEDHPF